MMKGLYCLQNAIKWYEDRFCVRFTPTVIYALYPKEEYGWPQPWPNPDSAGIYIFLDSNKTIVYIGTASQMGARLDHYFGYGENGKCILKDKRVEIFPMFNVILVAKKNPMLVFLLKNI